jgi:hypothetical protein
MRGGPCGGSRGLRRQVFLTKTQGIALSRAHGPMSAISTLALARGLSVWYNFIEGFGGGFWRRPSGSYRESVLKVLLSPPR